MIGTNPNPGWKKAAIGNRQCVAVVYIWITFKMKSRAITVGKKNPAEKKTQCWKSCKLQKKKKKKGGASWSFNFPTQWSQGCRCRTQSHGDGKVSSVHLPRMALPLSAETKRQLARLTLPSIELIAWLETSLGIKKKKKKWGKSCAFVVQCAAGSQKLRTQEPCDRVNLFRTKGQTHLLIVQSGLMRLQSSFLLLLADADFSLSSQSLLNRGHESNQFIFKL